MDNGSLSDSIGHIPERSDSSVGTSTTSTTITNNSSASTITSLAPLLRPIMLGGGAGGVGDGAFGPRTADRVMEMFSESAIELPNGERLVLKGAIGNGFYGTVYRGHIEDEYDRSLPKEVAVKVFNTNNGQQADLADFRREFHIMEQLKHANIVEIERFLDLPGEPLSIVMEHVANGSLAQYVIHRTLGTQKLLKFAQDIASGMEYLVGKRFVHRDLAARNVLVDANEAMKISDFGLAQVADQNGYYTTQNERCLPIKWYAPETLSSVKYSHCSDVWSYGVTLFEMFSRGSQPDLVPGRPQLPVDEMLARLTNGERYVYVHDITKKV